MGTIAEKPAEGEKGNAFAEGAAEEKPLFLRSVVKSSTGRIIAEYFFDGALEKGKRHYLFSSRFFAHALQEDLRELREHGTAGACNRVLEMLQDAGRRIKGRCHFESSTGKILNKHTISRLRLDMKMRHYGEGERLAADLLAKIESLGPRYHLMLREQMERCLNQDGK